jgi:hypothetical protein
MIDLQKKLQREVLRYQVGRAITCPITGTVLDVRTAVMVENSAGTAVLGVVSPEGWEQIEDNVLRSDPSVIVTKGSEL